MHVVVAWENSGTDPKTGLDCEYPLLVEDDYPEDVLTTWGDLGVPVPAYGRVQAITDLFPVDSTNPFCERCECAEPGTYDSEGPD